MVEEREENRGEFSGARVRVLGTNPNDPEEGRIFVWTKMGWFEREEGQSGDVAFIPVAKSEEELREFVTRDDPSSDLTPLSGDYRKMVSEEFMEQSRSYSDSPQYSKEASFEDEDQQYHQHD